MKKTMKHILALVIILPFLFVSCQKSENIETEKSLETGVYKDLPILCGEEYVANLVEWDETIAMGTVTVGNDENNLYVTFHTLDDWAFVGTFLYVGSAENVPDTTFGDGTGHFSPWNFPYKKWHALGVTEYTITISLDQLDECFIVVAKADLEDLVANETAEVWGKSNMKTLGYYFEYCKQECEPPSYDCETAYAYGDDMATCFLDIPEVKSNNWGWSNGPIEQGSDYTWDIYAGAGQCDITKGTLVGTLHVVYMGDDTGPASCTVTYNIDPDFTLDETHLYVGNDILAKKKNKYTTAPGQFPLSGGDTFTINNLEGEIYVVAHSVVCGDYDE